MLRKLYPFILRIWENIFLSSRLSRPSLLSTDLFYLNYYFVHKEPSVELLLERLSCRLTVIY